MERDLRDLLRRLRFRWTPSGLFVPVHASEPVEADPRPAFARVEAYLCASELLGEPVPLPSLIDHLRGFGAVPTFGLLAALAGDLANYGHHSRKIRSLTTDALLRAGERLDPRAIIIAQRLARHRERVIAHESVIYWLQGLALLECNDGDTEPSFAALAWLMLIANDHLQLIPATAEGRGSIETTLGNFARESRFNAGGDPATAIVRSYELMQTAPEHGPLADEESWSTLHREAFFGRSYHDYFVELLCPLATFAIRWGVPEAGRETPELPIIHRERWYAETALAASDLNEILDSLSVSLDEAREELEAHYGESRLAPAPPTFAFRPLLRLPEDRMIVSSPWLLRGLLNLGVWDRCRRAADRLHGSGVWNPAFGQSFEVWARAAAHRSAESPSFGPSVRTSETLGGIDELEDIVLQEPRRIALLSVKSRLMPAQHAYGAGDPTPLVDWYEGVLFQSRDRRGHRGAVRLLDERVTRIRAGEVEGVDPEARVYPVLLTYERMGESPLLHLWIRKRCSNLGLLAQPNVAPLTLLSPADYEYFLAAAARGIDIFEVLDRRGETDDGLVTFEYVLGEFADLESPFRRPGVDETLDALMAEVGKRLFNRSFGEGG